MHWATFCRYMVENKRSIPAKTWNEVRRAGLARYTERLRSGHADSELLFYDLIEKAERTLA